MSSRAIQAQVDSKGHRRPSGVLRAAVKASLNKEQKKGEGNRSARAVELSWDHRVEQCSVGRPGDVKLCCKLGIYFDWRGG